MKAKLYRGDHSSQDQQAGYKYYFVHFDANFNAKNERDGQGNLLVFIRDEEITGDIIRWSPFYAKVDFRGDGVKDVFFECPECGSKCCQRPNPNFADPHWWQGHFKCSRCGAGEFCYYSDCWIKLDPPKQQELF